ncbi:hypothetical protein [Arthrobacter sp. HMSC08H08]|uniref:hypothetical protein n=1 Tax=Arthrobacter sp. HMSC08H08 TaxID=1581143 RepID=UPI000AA94DCB|nr:hypothetical protein [Arthrobacter sp. HMSC08H08]
MGSSAHIHSPGPAINLPQGKAVFPDRADVPTSHNAEDVAAARARYEGALRRQQ